MPAAIGFCLVDQSPFYVFLIQSFYIWIKCFLITQRQLRIELVLAVEHIDITLVNHIAKHTHTCIPLNILPDSTLDIRSKTEKVAFVLIERTRLVVLQYTHLCRVLFPLVEVLIIDRLIAIEAIEVTHRIRLISSIQSQSMFGNQVFAIIVHTENTVVLGGICCLGIKRMDILWILRTITIVIDVRQCTTLETKIGIKCHRRQRSKVPTCLYLAPKRIHLLNFIFLRCVHRQREHSNDNKQEYTFHNSQFLIFISLSFKRLLQHLRFHLTPRRGMHRGKYR